MAPPVVQLERFYLCGGSGVPLWLAGGQVSCYLGYLSYHVIGWRPLVGAARHLTRNGATTPALSYLYSLLLKYFAAALKNTDKTSHYFFIVNNTLHELYFGRVVIFWIEYNEAPEYDDEVKI